MTLELAHAAFLIKGTITQRLSASFDSRSSSEQFEALVQTNGWSVRITPTDQPMFYTDFAYDSVNYYLVRDIPPYKPDSDPVIHPRSANTVKLSIEGETAHLIGEISQESLFEFIPPQDAAALWLAYGSFDYFRTHEKVPPFKALGIPLASSIDKDKIEDITKDFKTTQLDRFTDTNFPFLKNAVIWAPGYLPFPNGQKATLPPPFSNGYKYLHYVVERTTNINNVTIPTRMSLERTSAKVDESGKQRADLSYLIEAFEVREVPNESLAPPIPRQMFVSDHRFKDSKLGIDLIRYYLEDEWRPVNDSELVSQFQALRNETVRALGHLSPHQLILFLVILISLLLLLIVAFLQLKRQSNKDGLATPKI